ncbi:MAG: hypothetical protein ACJAYD_001134 [Patiriisocius sp.]|jgi:hypothetical protein
METKTTNSKVRRAKERVKKLKGFYNHLAIYLVINSIFICVNVYNAMDGVIDIRDPNFFKWMKFNTFSTAIFWGIGLFIHAIFIFDFPFLKNWEERKMKEFVAKENNKKNNVGF